MPVLTQVQIDEIIAEMEKDKRVQGILITGSYAYGEPNDKSDLDVRCVTVDQSNWAELERMRFGVPVEVFFNPPDIVRGFMRKSIEEGHGDCVHFWANGKIVYDPSGVIAQLQAEARKLWKVGPPSGGKWQWRLAKHKKHAERNWPDEYSANSSENG